VILEGKVRVRCISKAQSPDVLNAVVTDAKYDLVLPSVDGNGADRMVGAGAGGGHSNPRLPQGFICNREYN